MADNVKLTSKQLNAIIDAAYGLTNTLGEWANEAEDPSDGPMLSCLGLLHNEFRSFVAACPDMSGRQHSVAEIKQIVSASLELMNKIAVSFPNVDRVPETIREDIKSLYRALNDGGLIEASEG